MESAGVAISSAEVSAAGNVCVLVAGSSPLITLDSEFPPAPGMAKLEANINAKLSAMMQHILCASRIAHYIKVIIRDKVGSFMSALDCEKYLANWLYKYTTGREDLDWEEQARYPLRDAHVKVNEHPEKPGQYFCSIHLRPHYQLDQMISELELTTELIQKN